MKRFEGREEKGQVGKGNERDGVTERYKVGQSRAVRLGRRTERGVCLGRV